MNRAIRRPGCGLACALACVLALAAEAVALVIPAGAAETIVGTWATPGRCGRPLSTIVVEPMGFSGEDFSCDFDTVARTGDQVHWRGTCDFGAENGAAATSVTARLSKGMLRYRINGDG